MNEPLNDDEKLYALYRAIHSTAGATERWAERAATAMKDDELRQAVEYELSSFGGFTFGEGVSVIHKAKGLLIWAGRGMANVDGPPLFSGTGTMMVVRELCGIDSPDQSLQLKLF
jgi:hypothetical protein